MDTIDSGRYTYDAPRSEAALLAADVRRLQAENEKLKAALTAAIGDNWNVAGWRYAYCLHCSSSSYSVSRIVHASDCPVALAGLGEAAKAE